MRLRQTLAAALCVFALMGVALPARGDSESDNAELRREVRALEARVEELEARDKVRDEKLAQVWAQRPAAPVETQGLAPASVSAQGAAPATIESRLAAVEQQQQSSPKVSVGHGKGLSVTSADGQYAFSLRAYAQADDRGFVHGSGAGTDTFLIRTARPIIESKMTDYLNARLMWDFGQGNSRLLDGFVDFHPLPHAGPELADAVNIKAGEFKLPVGLERWQSEQDLNFVERGQTTNLVPFRDVGVMLHGQPFSGKLEYEAGIVNGATDLQVNTGDTDNDKDAAGRLLVRPFADGGNEALEGLALGVAGTYGAHHGTAAAPGLTSGYLTTGQRVFFAYTPAAGVAFANGADWRFNPQALYYNGSLGLMGEYVEEGQAISNGTVNATLRNSAWLASANYVLTGEKASYDGVVPLIDFDPAQNHWGAFELAARYSRLDIDSRTFPLFANPATQAREAQEVTAGGNWYFNPAFKINLDYSYSTFQGGNAGNTNRPNEQVVLTRGQFRF